LPRHLPLFLIRGPLVCERFSWQRSVTGTPPAKKYHGNWIAVIFTNCYQKAVVTPRPPIFVSAVSRELRSARQLVANTLTYLGYQPVWQDIFGTECGDLRGMLRDQIDQCKGVVQLVGRMYGSEPPSPDEEFGRVSYTQFEALYARKQRKRVWYLLIDPTFPTDTKEPEPTELTELQAAYRGRVERDEQLYHPLRNSEGLEATVLKLRDELRRLRRGVKQWATGVVILLVVLVGIATLILHKINRVEEMLKNGAEKFPEVKAAVLRDPAVRPAEVDERTYEILANQLAVDPKLLLEKLPQFAQALQQNSQATTLERANAAYISKNYDDAERLALAAAEEAKKSNPPRTSDAIKAYALAAYSLGWQGAYWKPGGDFGIVLDPVHNGAWSFKVSTNQPNHLRWIQPQRLEPHAKYRLTAWIRTESVAHSSEPYDRGANAAIQFMSPKEAPIHSEPVFGTSGWRQVSVEFETRDSIEIEVQLQLGGYSATTTGTAWFDDVQLKRVPQ
jgi:hypothetical protein